MGDEDRPLAGMRILLVEDEFAVAEATAWLLSSLGGDVVGPVGKLDRAVTLAAAEALDGALLDVNLNGAAVFPVADALAARGVPFVFSTGYDSLDLPERFRAAPCLEKPHDPFQLERRLVAAFRRD